MLVQHLILVALGSCLGSFLSLLAYRYCFNKDFTLREILFGRSKCESCGKELEGSSLVPILGWVLQRGHCKHCNAGISPLYPVGELILGVSFLLLYLSNGPLVSYFVVATLYFLSFCDIYTHAVPKKIVHLFVLTSVLLWGYSHFPFSMRTPELVEFFVATDLGWPLILASGLILLNAFKPSFGFGDILILFSLGLLLSGDEILYVFFIAVALAATYSVFMILTKQLTIKSYIPFLPFISLAWLTVQIFL